MEINSSRFGTIHVPDDNIITMERPVLGFESLRQFCLIEREEYRPFVWMQSVERPDIAFVLANPVLFFPAYRIEVHSKEIAELDVTDLAAVETWVIVTIPEDPSALSANLQGPIILNVAARKAKQLVLANSDYSVAHRLFSKQQEGHYNAKQSSELVEV